MLFFICSYDLEVSLIYDGIKS